MIWSPAFDGVAPSDEESKNKDVDLADGGDQVMQEIETSKNSCKEMLMGNENTETEEDVPYPLNDEEKITLFQDDVKISLDGPYP